MVADRRTSLPIDEVVRRADDLSVQARAVTGCEVPVVAVALPSSADVVVHLVAAVLGGYTVCFLDPTAPGDKSAVVQAALRPDAVADSTGLHRTDGAGSEELEPGYIAMSSGSTGGGPKGVLTTWESLADFLPNGVEALRLDQSSCWAEPSHPGFDLALTNWLLALSAGASLHVSSSLVDLLRPLAFTGRVGATHVRLAPRFVDLAVAEGEHGARAQLEVWGSGGDRLAPAQAERVLELGVKALVNTYGTSETGGFASAATFTSVDQISERHGSVSVGGGRVGSWGLEATTGAPDRPDDTLLAVTTPWVGFGYLFGGDGVEFPRWDLGRVVTGDRGVEYDGHWFCFGRSGRQVKRSATFVNLDEVDLELREQQGLVTFTVATTVGLLVTLAEGSSTEPEVILDRLSTAVARDLLPDLLVHVPRLPRLGNGKIDQAGAGRIAEQLSGQAADDPGAPTGRRARFSPIWGS